MLKETKKRAKKVSQIKVILDKDEKEVERDIIVDEESS
jgi:hypothetical protein